MKGNTMRRIILAALTTLALPTAAQDISAALLQMCEGVQPYDIADVAAVRAHPDDFCAVLLTEPRKARSQFNKMIVRNRAALNPNRWYFDARQVPAPDRSRYDGAFVQLRRPWMDASWDIVPNSHWCEGNEGQESRRLIGHRNTVCFTFTQYGDAGDEYGKFPVRRFYLLIHFQWDQDCQPRNPNQSCADDSRQVDFLHLNASAWHRCPWDHAENLGHIDPTRTGNAQVRLAPAARRPLPFDREEPNFQFEAINELLDEQQHSAC